MQQLRRANFNCHNGRSMHKLSVRKAGSTEFISCYVLVLSARCKKRAHFGPLDPYSNFLTQIFLIFTTSIKVWSIVHHSCYLKVDQLLQ